MKQCPFQTRPRTSRVETMPRSPVPFGGTWLGICALFWGCAAQSESVLKDRLSEREEHRTELSKERSEVASNAPGDGNTSPGANRGTGTEKGEAATADANATAVGPREGTAHKPAHSDTDPGRVASYVADAMAESPELQASFDRWRASVRRISRGRRLPDPVLSFGFFIRSVETRVGPQRARIGLSQTFPWPTRLSASAEAAAATSQAAESQFDALALRIQAEVVRAYYRLWLIRKLRQIHAEHLEVLRSLSETILARVATGAANLADQQQVDLSAARLEDQIAALNEEEIAAKAQLGAILGTRERTQFPTTEPPPEAVLPRESTETLEQAALNHPFLESYEYRARAHEETARALKAEGLPSFSIGADWIITDEATASGVPDSGKDAVIVGGGVSLPLWGNYGENAEASRAEARASRSERVAMEEQALAEVRTKRSQVRDATRRVNLYQYTLVPQAESAYSSVLGSYAAGRGTVAQALLIQRELLELRGELERARADYSIAWAGLEQIVGRSIERGGTSTRSEESNQ